MNQRMKWTDFQDGAVGVLPCALMTVIIWKEAGDGFLVRFGARRAGPFGDMVAAKKEGLAMIRDVLTECLVNLGPW